MKHFKVIGYLFMWIYTQHYYQTVSAQIIQTKYPLRAFNLTSLETATDYIVAGQFDTRIWLNPFNGVYISRDFGNTWSSSGLASRGVTDIYINQGILYASTYYMHESKSGLFISEDDGKTYRQSGPNVSGLSVCATTDLIYFGTYSHGLWVSKDKGTTWTQLVGDGYFGPKIYEIACLGSQLIYAGENNTYMSNNEGNTFIELVALSSHRVRNIVISTPNIFAGTDNGNGLFKSDDMGSNWEPDVQFIAANVLEIKKNATNVTVIYTSSKGTYAAIKESYRDWKLLDLPIRSTYGAGTTVQGVYNNILYSEQSAGIIQVSYERFKIPQNNFLIPPWDIGDMESPLDYITAYFDHEYPMLGYSKYSEPASKSSDTLNFLGERGSPPKIYYSSHDGIDFGVPFGENVLAAGDGLAEYYYCSECGHSIKIDHLNGFQSTYMHLQESGLITKSTSEKTIVYAGDIIGKVGLTGRTTGPHIHISMQKDLDNDGVFWDDYPQNKTDPYGWFPQDISDPWNNYTWNDQAGNHTGTSSEYLWNKNPEVKIIPIVGTNNAVNFQNLSVIIPSLSSATLQIQKSTKPEINPPDLSYIKSTSYTLDAINYLGKNLDKFSDLAEIKILVSKSILDKFLPETVQMFYLDEVSITWKTLHTIVDTVSGTVTGLTPHFSKFAVFGEPKEKLVLNSEAEIIGNFLIISSHHKPESYSVQLLYSLDDGSSWEQYINPLEIGGLPDIVYYRAVDNEGNLETVKSINIPMNKPVQKYRFTDEIVFENVGVSVGNY